MKQIKHLIVIIICLIINDIKAISQTINKMKTMKTIFHQAETRGHANHGWLDSYHTFSFAGYYEPSRIHFGALRVLNDDIVKGGFGFGRHPHDNMEIISIPLKGALAHADNTGGKGTIQAGEVQIMSAGTGVEHSEQNASRSDEVNFLQIWVFPKEKNIAPRYDQKKFEVSDRSNQWQTLVSPEKNEQSLWINQDAWFSRTALDANKKLTYQMHLPNQGAYVFVIDGSISIGEQTLNKRDGLGISQTQSFEIIANSKADILVIEVPMQMN